jgi:Zn-finger nucleic acid-binding protein
LKLVACPKCRAQYDVEHLDAPTVTCRCGATFPATPPAARDVAVTRCSACGALVGETETSCSYCHAQVIRRPAPFGPVCPECYARNAENARYCASCGIAFLPQPVRTRVEALHCPVCSGSGLSPRSLGGIWVEECPQCLGLWTPGDVLDRLIERIRERLEQENAPAHATGPPKRRSKWQPEFTYRKCPECGVMMQRRNFGRRSGVVVDWCGSHGTWLDSNELEDIADFVMQGGLRTVEAGAERSWALPADPNRLEAFAAAERILAEERVRSQSRKDRFEAFVGSLRLERAPGAVRGIGDLFSLILQRRA